MLSFSINLPFHSVKKVLKRTRCKGKKEKNCGGKKIQKNALLLLFSLSFPRIVLSSRSDTRVSCYHPLEEEEEEVKKQDRVTAKKYESRCCDLFATTLS